MKLSFPIKFSSFSLVVLLASSCAHQYGIKALSQKNSKDQTPTETINQFKYQSQKRDLDQTIANDGNEKPEFLRKVENKKVNFWVKYFTGKGKARFERYLKNGEKYRPLIEEVFDDYGLPKELFFVGLIESGYYLKAKSHANAVGPWQFISATARRYGLNVRRGLDERQNIAKATKAAALFFQDLYNIFGSWELALSAYNAGEYGIIRRIRKAKTRDYYELSAQKKLPKETRHYVPKVIAALQVYNNASRYGIKIPHYKNNIYTDLKEIKLYQSISLKRLAQKTKVPYHTLRMLNPDIKWAHTPRLSKGLSVFLPNKKYNLKTLAKYQKKSKRTVASRRSSKKIDTTQYRVRRGDNLYNIARSFDTSIRELIKINRLKRKTIFIGQKLKVPAKDFITYKVRRGDNLHTLARRNHTSITKIQRLNNMRSRTIYIGQKLKIPQADVDTYIVQRGDYLLKIAKKHKTSVRQLKRLNKIRNSKIYPGQRLIVSNN